MAADLLRLDENDVCYDIGAGDGRFLSFLCKNCNGNFVGVEVLASYYFYLILYLLFFIFVFSDK